MELELRVVYSCHYYYYYYDSHYYYNFVFVVVVGAYSYAAEHEWCAGDLYEGKGTIQGQ